MGTEELNRPRWPDVSGKITEAWYIVGSDPRAQQGVWLRYALDRSEQGEETGAVWGSWFEEGRTFAVRKLVDGAAIRRSVEELDKGGCSGEVEAGGRSLRWRLSFGQGPAAREFFPAWLRPVARARGSGYVLPHPATTLTGAIEIDGRIIDLQRMPASQAHLWGKTSFPEWAWAHCSAFAEDPEAALEIVDVNLGWIRVPVFSLRFRGVDHQFGQLPWIGMTVSRPAAPVWHFAAQDATLAIDGVVQAAPAKMVQVHYAQTDGSTHHCINTELASVELRVRSRAFVGASWRPEATLTCKGGASLEFRGREADARVTTVLVTAGDKKQAPAGRSVAS